MPVSNDFKAVSGFLKLQEQQLSLKVEDQDWNNIKLSNLSVLLPKT